jgi:thioredoxin-related protein
MMEREKLLVMFGSDECIFKQCLLIKKAWALPTSETQSAPKEEGKIVITKVHSKKENLDLDALEAHLKLKNK